MIVAMALLRAVIRFQVISLRSSSSRTLSAVLRDLGSAYRLYHNWQTAEALWQNLRNGLLLANLIPAYFQMVRLLNPLFMHF
jgi:hypothetical protein